MWREFITGLNRPVTFENPTSPSQLANAEKELGAALPNELRELLLESDGVEGECGPAVIWPAERILRDNLEFRSTVAYRELYMPFDCLLFFGDDGGGDQFAYAILDGEIRWDKIYRWCHETDGREYVVWSLRSYLEQWAIGAL